MRNINIANISHFCLFTLAFSFVLLVVSLIIGIGNGLMIFPIAMICAYVIAALESSRQQALWAAGWGIVIMAVSILASAMLCDYSCDGNYYHQQSTALLAQGWNPYHMDSLLSCDNPWVRHYGIGIEMMASTIVCLTGSLEAGKAVNLIFIISALGLVYAFLRQNTPIKRRIAVLASLAIIGSPVVICQMLTYYIDWAKYIYDVILLLAIYGLVHRWNWRDALTGATVIVLAVATKFNVWFEACLLIALSSIWLAAIGRWRIAFTIAAWGLTSVAVGVGICYHPYYHNYLIGGHIFYPLMGEGAYDIMAGNTPDVYTHGRVIDFFVSLLSISLPSVDQRQGGFGPLMPLMLIISFWIVIGQRKNINKAWIYAMVAAFLSCFIFEQTWWSRYISQLWLVPALALASALRYGVCRRLRNVLLAMMLVSTAFSLVYVAYVAPRMSLYRHFLYEAMRENQPALFQGPLPQTIMHCTHHGISVKEIPENTAPDDLLPVKFYYGPACEPILFLDSMQYSRFVNNLHSVPVLVFERYDAQFDSIY